MNNTTVNLTTSTQFVQARWASYCQYCQSAEGIHCHSGRK